MHISHDTSGRVAPTLLVVLNWMIWLAMLLMRRVEMRAATSSCNKNSDGDILEQHPWPCFHKVLLKNSLQVYEINTGSLDVMRFHGFEDFFDSKLIVHG